MRGDNSSEEDLEIQLKSLDKAWRLHWVPIAHPKLPFTQEFQTEKLMSTEQVYKKIDDWFNIYFNKKFIGIPENIDKIINEMKYFIPEVLKKLVETSIVSAIGMFSLDKDWEKPERYFAMIDLYIPENVDLVDFIQGQHMKVDGEVNSAFYDSKTFGLYANLAEQMSESRELQSIKQYTSQRHWWRHYLEEIRYAPVAAEKSDE